MKMQKGYMELTPSTLTREIQIDEPMLVLMAILATGSSSPITREEMLLRWITKGCHFDQMLKSEQEIELFVSRHVRILRK
jgi:hypothetical protein